MNFDCNKNYYHYLLLYLRNKIWVFIMIKKFMKSFAAGAALGKLFDNEINKMEADEKWEKLWEKQEKEKAKFKEKIKKMPKEEREAIEKRSARMRKLAGLD